MLSFRLCEIGATDSAEIFFRNCLIHLIAFVTCCHPFVTLKSRLGLEERPCVLDHVTVLTDTNLLFISHHALLKYQFSPFSPWLIVNFFSLHCISFLVLYCVVLLYCCVLGFLMFKPESESEIKKALC